MDTFTLRIDGGTQPRERLDEATVERYAEAMAAGLWDFGRLSDPAVAFYDGTEHWLSDGFHRLEAAKRAGKLDEFSACLEVRQGTVRDAILYSVGANAHHGFPRSDDDKRRVVSRLLGDPEWSKWSDREIARRCYVTHPFVGKLRASTGTVSSERTYTTKHGTVATMDTSAIGKAKPAAPAPEWPLPENASGGVRAVARSRGVLLPDAGATDATAEPVDEPTLEPENIITTEAVGEPPTEPVGELRVDPGLLPGRLVAAANEAYRTLKTDLTSWKPALPSQALVEAMTSKQRATIRRLTEQSRAWAVGLLAKIEKVDGAQ